MVRRLIRLFPLLLALVPVVSHADALVRSNAMFASTIAEYFVEQDGVRVDLEVGLNDLEVFRNLLPDEVYQQMEFGDRPLAERLEELTQRDLAILVNGEALSGHLLSLGPETRVMRDEVTGEPLPPTEEEPEIVVRASFWYPFETRPDSLSLVAPQHTGMAGIGFVLYHLGVAVNDFRFLSSGYTVSLDWEDSWYSNFDTRALRRQYYAPMTGFIYVEPFEVRKEIIVRPKDIQRYVDLGLEGRDTIPAAMQQSVKDGIVAFLNEHFPVKIDGQPVEGTIDRVNFLQRTLRSSIVVDGQDVALLPSTVGVITVFPTGGLPELVEMDWTLFNDRMQMIPASTVDEAGPLPTFIEPDFSVLRWENFLKHPELPTLTDVSPPPTALQGASSWGRWAFAAGALLLLVPAVRTGRAGSGNHSRNRWVMPSLVLILALLAGFAEHQWRQVRPEPERLVALTGSLLHNIYRAFDHRGEEAIYDVLAQSVTGDLLADVYLETRRGLELENQGGAQVKVRDIEMLEARLDSTDGDSMMLEARWNVSGSVGHWGHVHQRSNGYHANLTISEVDGVWKLSLLDILTEERL